MLFIPLAVATSQSAAPSCFYLGTAPRVAQRPHFPVPFPGCQVEPRKGTGVSLYCEPMPWRKAVSPGNKKREILKSAAKALVGRLSVTLLDFVCCGNYQQDVAMGLQSSFTREKRETKDRA